MRRGAQVALVIAALLSTQCHGRRHAPGEAQSSGGPPSTYWVFVANEASDVLSLVRFGPDGIRVERETRIDPDPTAIDGLHGIAVSPDGQKTYVTTAHGTPFGVLWELDAWTGAILRQVSLGRFPATIGLVPDGSRAFVVNFNLHGRPVPSSVSVVFLPSMTEEARIETCVRPHGSRSNASGTHLYTGCMGSDQLVEISTRTSAVARRVDLADLTGAACGPTWVLPGADDTILFVACHRLGQVLELDRESLRIVRRMPAGAGVYNLAVSGDGRLLLATNKGAQTVSVLDLASGEALAAIRTTRPVPHGVVISPDDRFAFVTSESVGAVPGTIDVIDLNDLAIVASHELLLQPGGIDFWRSE